MKKILFFICVGLVLTGCADTKKHAPMEGRIAVSSIINPEVTKASPTEKISLGKAEDVTLWPQTSATGQNQAPHANVSGMPQKLWSTNIGEDLNSKRWTLGEPVVSKGIIYALDADFNLSAVQLSNGKKVWTSKLELTDPTSIRTIGLAYSYDKLFAVAGNGTVYCVDLKGKTVWKKDMKLALRSAPTIYQNKIYLVSADNQLIVLDTTNGAEVWRYKGMPVETNLMGMGTPAIYKNMAVVPFSNGEVVTFNTETQNIVWSDYLSSDRTFNRISDLTHILASPVISDGIVYLIGNANKMGAYNLMTGEEIWTLPMGGDDTPSISGNTLFVVNNQGILVALDKKTGKLIWDRPLKSHEKKGTTLWKGPMLAGNNAVVVSSRGDIVFVDLKTGAVKNTLESDEFSIAPIAVNNTLIFLTNEADLIAYK